MIKGRVISRALFSLLTAALSCGFASAASNEEFILRLTLMDYGATVVETRVAAGKPFDTSRVINGTAITIKGDLAAKRDNLYHLRLMLAEWRSEKNHLTQTIEFDLTPGKAAGFGFISSFVYERTVLLSRVPKMDGHQ